MSIYISFLVKIGRQQKRTLYVKTYTSFCKTEGEISTQGIPYTTRLLQR
jgi:hypothetical protein